MVDDRQLTSVLSEFADTLATDFPIISILDHLVHRIVTILPVTSAGVTLIEPGRDPRYVAASDNAALRFEQVQTDLGEGPCLLAYRSGRPVSVPDLARDDRFPTFGPAAVESGMSAVFTFPLHHGHRRLGALDLYRESPGELDSRDMEAAETLASVTSAYLINARARADADDSSAQMRHIATHDELTGLPNRLLLLQRMEHAGQRARRSRTSAGVLFIDLDHFKKVNDTHGHPVGDQLLRAVAKRLSGLVRPGDTLARVYGDEFVVLCEDVHDRGDVEHLADRVRRAFVAPFLVGDLELSITSSVGVACSAAGEQISERTVTEADVAMYEQKRAGGGQFLPTQRGMSGPKVDRSPQTEGLALAMEQGELQLAYQPIVASPGGAWVGVEALVRWTPAESEPVPASTIIASAERSGLITELGAWALEHACRASLRWTAAHPGPPLDLSVNVSAYELSVPGFADGVRRTLEGVGFPRERLVLEVTENVLIEDNNLARSVLAELRELGVRIALDDFGTGYSSLSYLHQLPVDVLKMDRSLMTPTWEGRSRAIVGAVTSLAHGLGLQVVVEGVETATQGRIAAEVGADLAQGFFYARPMTAASVGRLLATATDPTGHVVLPRRRLTQLPPSA